MEVEGVYWVEDVLARLLLFVALECHDAGVILQVEGSREVLVKVRDITPAVKRSDSKASRIWHYLHRSRLRGQWSLEVGDPASRLVLLNLLHVEQGALFIRHPNEHVGELHIGYEDLALHLLAEGGL